jgi:acyl-CoA reductase-like NAD-dependent aldehyde dehydrogenase
MASPHVAAISFTGSTTVGETIAAHAGMTKLHLELGGKAAAVVLDDADLRLAAQEICKGTFKLSGQRCDAISRVLVHERVKDALIAEVMTAAISHRLADPLDENTTLGPLVNGDALAKVKRLVESAVQAGARALQGGTHDGLFY